MPYVAPSTKSQFTTLTSTEWNTIVNDIIDLNLRISAGPTASRPSGTLGMAYYDTTVNMLYVYQAATGGNTWQPIGNFVVCASTTRPTTPQNGLIIHETDTLKRYVYNGAAWVEITNGVQLLTTTQRNALSSPSTGTIVFDTTIGELFVYGLYSATWTGIGNTIICTSTTRPTLTFNGLTIYETDTNKLYRYNTTTTAWLEVTNGYPTVTTTQLTSLTALTPTVGAVAFDSTVQAKKMYTSTGAGSVYLPFGNYLSGTYAQRPSTPHIGQLFYQTDTDEVVKYVTDLDGQNRWMQADHDVRRNMIINGNFEIVQRRGIGSYNPVSTTVTSASNYFFDRWQCLQATTTTGGFIWNSIPPGSSVPFANQFAIMSRTTGETFVTPFTMQQAIEYSQLRNARYNKPITLSFWASKGAGFSATGSILTSKIVGGTGTDGVIGTMTGQTTLAQTNHTLTTTWQRFTVTLVTNTLGTSLGELGISFSWTPVGTAVASDACYITGVQLEVGSAPSDNEAPNYNEEMFRCQRYFYSPWPTNLSQTGLWGSGTFISATQALINTRFSTPLRTSPTALFTTSTSTAGGFALTSYSASGDCSALPVFIAASPENAITRFTTAAAISAAAGQGAFAGTGSAAAGRIGWSAEM